MSEHQDAVFRAVQRLFALYERGNDLERAGAYARALVRLPLDRIERAIEWAEQTWDAKSPPPVPWLLKVAWKHEPPKAAVNPVSRADAEAEAERLKILRYHLERFSMADWYEFRRGFGYPVSQQLYDRLGVAVPAGVTFIAPDPAWCNAERSRSRSECGASFQRLGAKHQVAMPEPEAERMARAARDGRALAAGEELPF